MTATAATLESFLTDRLAKGTFGQRSRCRGHARSTVSLPDDLVDVLLPLLAAKPPDALLFTNTVGQQLTSSRFWTTTWTPALDAACPALDTCEVDTCKADLAWNRRPHAPGAPQPRGPRDAGGAQARADGRGGARRTASRERRSEWRMASTSSY
jgi:hypothetical protein